MVLIVVGCSTVMVAVPVTFDATTEVAVTVITFWLLEGNVVGAVYTVDVEDPVLEILPVPAGLMDQFTRVLLSFVTLAVQVDWAPSCTVIGLQDTITDGVAVDVDELLPHELMIHGAKISARNQEIRFQRSHICP